MAKKKVQYPKRKAQRITAIAVVAVVLAVIIGLLSFNSYSKSYIMKFNGKNVSAPEFRIALLAQQMMFESYLGTQVWSYELEGGVTMVDQAKTQALESVLYTQVLKLHAADYDITLTSDNKKEAKDGVATFKQNYGENVLTFIGMTDSKIRNMLENGIIADKVAEAFKATVEVPQEEIDADYAKYLEEQKLTYIDYKVNYIKVADKALADELRAKIADGESLSSLIAENSLDYDAEAENPLETKSVKDLSLPAEVKNTIPSMEVGAVSEVLSDKVEEEKSEEESTDESEETTDETTEEVAPNYYILELVEAIEPDYDTLKSEHEKGFIDNKKTLALEEKFKEWKEDESVVYTVNQKVYDDAKILPTQSSSN